MSNTNIRLRELRKKAGLSMKQLGDLFSMSEAAISFYETGKRQLSPDLLIKFANYFDVSVDYLLGNSNKPFYIGSTNKKDSDMFQIKLKELREKHKLSQAKLAKLLNVSQSTVAMWENGENKPKYEKIINLCQIFNVSAAELLDDQSLVAEHPSPVWVPVLGSVQAGVPSEAIQNITDYEDISNITSCMQDYFALKIKDSSMGPRFSEGDVVIVKKQSDVKDGEIAIILVNGNEAACRKIKKTPQGVMLIPLNSAFETMLYSDEEILSLPVVIIGKVVELRAKF